MDDTGSIYLIERKSRLENIIKTLDMIIKGRDSDHYYWLKNLAATLKASATAPMCLTLGHRVGGRGHKSAYINSYPQMLAQLRGAMLSFRYIEALTILKVILQNRYLRRPITIETALYRCGMEIFYNTAECTHGILPGFVNQLKQLVTALNTPQIIVEKSLHHLSQNNLEEAKECIETVLPNARGTLSNHTSAQYASTLQNLYSAYISYLEWQKSSAENEHEENSFDDSYNQNLRMVTSKHREDALVKFEFLQSSDVQGVWDILIKPYITLLLSKREKKEALEFLISYKNGSHHLYTEFEPSKNPNSYIYLIDFLTDHPDIAPPNLLRETYREYIELVPSDYRMAARYLTMIPDQLYSSIEIIMNLLDYPSNSGQIDLWRKLDSLLEECSDKAKLTVLWNGRRTWWPSVHMNFHQNTQLQILINQVVDQLKRL